MYEAEFAVVIPECINTAQLPVPAVLFGHGLFGTGTGYIKDDFLQRAANEKCFVIFAGDLIGLTERQIAISAFSANDLNRSHALSEKLGQAVINIISLEHLMRGAMASSPEFMLDGTPIIDTDNIWYLGGSLGGIMGGTFMAYDPFIELGALGVPGSNWSLLLERSFAWSPLQIAAVAAYGNPYDYQMLVSFLAFSLERWDPITTARRVIADPLPNTPEKQILVYETLNDSLVTNLATEMLVRTMDLPVLAPTVKMPPLMALTTDPVLSGFTIYDENVPVATLNNVPPTEDNGTHAGVNERQAVLDQLDHFFRQREIINTCGETASPAVCDCSTGACD